MKRAIVLNAEDNEEDQMRRRQQCSDYAKEHNLKIVDELKYHFLVGFTAPELLINKIDSYDVEVVLADEQLLTANFYNDNKILKLLSEKGLSVGFVGIRHEVLEMLGQLTPENIDGFKSAINETITKGVKDKLNHEAIIITKDASSREFQESVESIMKKGGNNFSVLEIDIFSKELVPVIFEKIRNDHVESIYIFNQELMNDELKQCIKDIQQKYEIEVVLEEQIIKNQNIGIMSMQLN